MSGDMAGGSSNIDKAGDRMKGLIEQKTKEATGKDIEKPANKDEQVKKPETKEDYIKQLHNRNIDFNV